MTKAGRVAVVLGSVAAFVCAGCFAQSSGGGTGPTFGPPDTSIGDDAGPDAASADAAFDATAPADATAPVEASAPPEAGPVDSGPLDAATSADASADAGQDAEIPPGDGGPILLYAPAAVSAIEGLVVSGGFAYLAVNPTGLVIVPTSGTGTPTTYSTIAVQVQQPIVAYGSNLYLCYGDTATGQFALGTMPLGGGVVTTLMSSAAKPVCGTFLAVDSTGIYWTSGNDLVSVPLTGLPDGGTPTTLWTGDGYASSGLLLAGGTLYWSSLGIFSMPAGGGAVTTVASNAPGTEGVQMLALVGGDLYWGDLETFGRGAVESVPVDAGAVQTLVSGLDQPSGIASDGTNLYATNGENQAPLGSVLQVPLDGGVATTLVTGWEASWIAVDSSWVYWVGNQSDAGPLSLYKIAK
jgi:hypothetical protein